MYVIDTGMMKEKGYDSFTKMSSLQSSMISRANAKQRAGRAGRVQEGICFRLYSKRKFESMAEFQLPELLRSPLEEICLQVKLLGLGKCSTFLAKAMQAPDEISIESACDLLKRMDAFDANEDLTPLGRHLACLPMDPRLGKMLLMGVVFKCLDPGMYHHPHRCS